MAYSVKEMLIPDMADYINGKKFIGKYSNYVRIEESFYLEFLSYLSMYDSAEYMFQVLQRHTDFFKCCPDFAHFFPEYVRKEVFYAAKNGFYSLSVPSDCIYMIKKAYDLYKIPNLIFRQISAKDLTAWFSEGYLMDGYTLKDVVCTYCLATYRPFDSDCLKTVHKSFTELYIRNTNMVAAVPNKLGELLSVDVLDDVECNSALGLHINGTYLRSLAGYYGACNSHYDLRNLF